MINENNEDSTYVYQENPTKKKTLRELRSQFAMQTPYIRNSTTNHHYDSFLGLNTSIENNTDSSVTGFKPGLASTPIRSNLVQHHTADNPIWSAQQRIDRGEAIIIDHTVNNAIDLTSCDQNKLFWPVGTLDNIIENNNSKDQKKQVDNICTERIFEVPNTMIAYVFDEATEYLQPMKIIILNNDVSTYEPLKSDANDVMINKSTSHTDANTPKKMFKDKPYRRTTLKWKNVRDKMPRRVAKPIAQNISSTTIPQLTGLNITSHNDLDKDYKPPSKYRNHQGINCNFQY